MDTAAEDAIDGVRETLADPLDTTVEDASRGVFDVALATTVGAIREITVEKGLDPGTSPCWPTAAPARCSSRSSRGNSA